MLEKKTKQNTITEVKNICSDPISRLDLTEKQSSMWKIGQKKLQKLKYKEKEWEKKTYNSWDNFQKCNIIISSIAEQKKLESRIE